ncbi:unnamed protein product [Choristocarpus tenellus]
MEEPEMAAQAVAGTKEEGVSLGAQVEAKGVTSLVEGEEEKAYWVRKLNVDLYEMEMFGGRKKKKRKKKKRW